ncbi:16S rRNA (guanine(527)-N(7))-methyltransferase RsmG [Aquisphaera insulae]|uniref:16S rRNA (guanine(527)-N(7))-methyltransferase RsmG n=1 Tax=Aquisphaera insulae TaxID=2712864 RepID=UPI00202E588E|nr:16S rRNA (guanine(527)-N(7))-methyltransferase RsmG [Aquisphaera insulae]
MRPGRESLEKILRSCGIHLDRTQLDLLWTYHGMLREANARLNLTRIHNFENMVLKHYADSLLVLKFVDLPSPLIDMGSGPGLPGIPLKIASPSTRMILAEPRGARASFLGEVCHRLGLDGADVYPNKLGSNYPGTVQGVISRAVAEIPETLDRVAACLAPGGRMIFMKGPECDDEIAQAAREHGAFFRLEADHAYEIPGTTHRRRLVVYERLEGEAPARRSEREPERAFAGQVRDVSSESNASFRLLRDLLSGRGIRKHGQAIVAGTRIIDEVLARYPGRAIGWITAEGGPPPAEQAADVTWYRLAPPLFREIDVAGTNSPLLLVEAPPLPQWSDADEWPEGCTLFVPFQDPENVGAVIRSAAAFGVSRVVLLRESAHPFHPRSSRAAGTGLFQVPLLQGPSIRELATAEAPLIALDTNGPELSEEPWPSRFGLVVGLEGPGLPDHLRDGPRRRIAIRPDVESLNAATAAAVALHAIATGRGLGAE